MTGAAYTLITDSCCDLPATVVDEIGVEVLHFGFVAGGKTYVDDLGRTTPHAEFYAAMREGSEPTTTHPPLGEFVTRFEAAAQAGEEVVFASFSSALSGSYATAMMARDGVLVKHPDARIRIVDTRRASIAQGLIVFEAAKRRRAGVSAAELQDWLDASRLSAVGVFTLDTLEHLRRGGRIGDVTAAAGAMLDVRPLLGFTDAGELTVIRAVRGRKKSLKALAESVVTASGGRCPLLLVGHGDAAEDAATLETLVREQADVGEVVLCDVGPVIGSHTGPGMVAASFWADGAPGR